MWKAVQGNFIVLFTLICSCDFTSKVFRPRTKSTPYAHPVLSPPSRPVHAKLYPPPSRPHPPPPQPSPSRPHPPPPPPSPFLPQCPVVNCPVITCPVVSCPETNCPPPSVPPAVELTCNCNERGSCPPPGMPGGEDKCKWHLVFKAVKGNGRNVYTDFMDSTTINPNSAEAMVISSNTLPFKSQKMNEWNQLVIKQVKFEVFNEGERKSWFLFDGTATTPSNWYSQDRLIASPYKNLKTVTLAFFSPEGKPSANIRGYIAENDGPCSEDCGYFAVVNTGADQCPWAKIEPQPYFLYNPNTDDCFVWNDANKVADVIAISIKTCELEW